MITSSQNAQIKELRKLSQRKYLKERSVFPIEGVTMLREALRSEVVPKEIYVSKSYAFDFEKEFNLPFSVVVDELMQSISSTVSGRELIALVPKEKDHQIPEVPRGLYVYLQDVQDPGNVGTIIRSAEAFGLAGVCLSPDSAYIYNDKVVRSSMGSIFRMPHCVLCDDDVFEFKKKGYAIVTCAPRGGQSFSTSWDGAFLIIGNESSGVSQDMMERADGILTIPMEGMVESLNAGVAASIAMFMLVGED
ncbi:MAG: RNA methyltransferase [Tissierellia bacterium]|nr:RNA methyltransferase [Tissierellia bacterium]